MCSDFMGRAADGIMPLLRPLWGMPRRQLLDLLWGNDIEVCLPFSQHAMQGINSITDRARRPIANDLHSTHHTLPSLPSGGSV